MNINLFSMRVTRREGKKRQVSIAQVKEILKVINDITKGAFYKLIRSLE